jgi:hypothetical protein
MMATETSILRIVRGELGKEARIVPRLHAIALRYDNGVLFMDGELDSVAAKRLALERVAKLCCVLGIVDRLHVTPSVRMGDGEIARRLGEALVREDLFSDCAIAGADGRTPRPLLRHPSPSRGTIRFAIRDGVVTLDGEVAVLDHKRLAGVLAWWVPGSRDVVNGIAVEPPEEDTDANLVGSLRMVLKKDLHIASARIHIAARDCVVSLSGWVDSRAERDMAENDAWCLFGVDRVENAIVVGP